MSFQNAQSAADDTPNRQRSPCPAPPDTGGTLRISALIALLLVSAVVSVFIGAHPLSFADIAQLFSAGTGADGTGTETETVSLLVYEIRLPRIAASASIGAALALAGAAFQSLFRNSLVSPGILGASSGAAFGAALAMLLSLPVVAVQATAFAGGLGAVLLAAVLGGGWRATPSPLRLVLTGMVVGQLCGSGVAIVKLLADTESKLPAITFWLMGGLSGMARGDLVLLLPPLAAGAVVVLRLRWSLNLLALGEDEARALGAPVRATRVLTLLGATLLASACVAVAGVVGWVGLMAPHAARCWVGPNNRDLLPVAALLGALFMLWADNAARSLASAEIPLGIVTSVVGAPVFLAMLQRLGRGWTRE